MPNDPQGAKLPWQGPPWSPAITSALAPLRAAFRSAYASPDSLDWPEQIGFGPSKLGHRSRGQAAPPATTPAKHCLRRPEQTTIRAQGCGPSRTRIALAPGDTLNRRRRGGARTARSCGAIRDALVDRLGSQPRHSLPSGGLPHGRRHSQVTTKTKPPCSCRRQYRRQRPSPASTGVRLNEPPWCRSPAPVCSLPEATKWRPGPSSIKACYAPAAAARSA